MTGVEVISDDKIPHLHEELSLYFEGFKPETRTKNLNDKGSC